MYGLTDCPVDLDKLTASIKAHEGLRLSPYDDATGNLTIGYGRNLTGDGISNAEANYLLGNDLQSAIGEAEAQPWWNNVKDNDARSRALIECIFNLGIGKFNGFTKAIAALCTGDFETAGAELLNSLWAREVGKRAEVLAAMVQTGVD